MGMIISTAAVAANVPFTDHAFAKPFDIIAEPDGVHPDSKLLDLGKLFDERVADESAASERLSAIHSIEYDELDHVLKCRALEGIEREVVWLASGGGTYGIGGSFFADHIGMLRQYGKTVDRRDYQRELIARGADPEGIDARVAELIAAWDEYQLRGKKPSVVEAEKALEEASGHLGDVYNEIECETATTLQGLVVKAHALSEFCGDGLDRTSGYEAIMSDLLAIGELQRN